MTVSSRCLPCILLQRDSMYFGVILYFVLVISLLILVCPWRLRNRAMSTVAGILSRACAAGFRVQGAGLRRLPHHQQFAQDVSLSPGAATRRHAVMLSGALLFIVALPFGAALLRSTFRADSYDPNASRLIDERVARLLEGEALVPPPLLPPDLFATPDVEAWQPLSRSASRQWALLDPGFRQRLLLTFKLVREQYGYEMILVEGYRSPQRQAALAALGTSVTRAGPFESAHQFGLAADCAFLRDGRIVISEKDQWAMKGYAHFSEVAKSLGLVWGGNWPNLLDFGHVELPKTARGTGGLEG